MSRPAGLHGLNGHHAIEAHVLDITNQICAV
jgi:hypothetical protein